MTRNYISFLSQIAFKIVRNLPFKGFYLFWGNVLGVEGRYLILFLSPK